MISKLFRLFVLLILPSISFAANAAEMQKIQITHTPMLELTTGKRAVIEAEVEDTGGVEIARVYFKMSDELKDYYFIPMENQGGNRFMGILPSPDNTAKEVEYLILVKNAAGQIVKTQIFRVVVKPNDDTAGALINNEKMTVYTELETPPAEIAGFSDNLVVDTVESSAKLAAAAQLYNGVSGVGSTSSAASAGTAAQGISGISTTTWVVGGVAAAAIVGGAVALSSSGSDGTSADATSSRSDAPFTGSFKFEQPAVNSPSWILRYILVLVQNGSSISGRIDRSVTGCCTSSISTPVSGRAADAATGTLTFNSPASETCFCSGGGFGAVLPMEYNGSMTLSSDNSVLNLGGGAFIRQ